MERRLLHRRPGAARTAAHLQPAVWISGGQCRGSAAVGSLAAELDAPPDSRAEVDARLRSRIDFVSQSAESSRPGVCPVIRGRDRSGRHQPVGHRAGRRARSAAARRSDSDRDVWPQSVSADRRAAVHAHAESVWLLLVQAAVAVATGLDSLTGATKASVTQATLLSDELLRRLISVGQVDIVVGVPTLNHADTIAETLDVVDQGLLRYFARARTVVIGADGGSTDQTLAIVADPAGAGGTRIGGLRTRHRLAASYRGLPGR